MPEALVSWTHGKAVSRRGVPRAEVTRRQEALLRAPLFADLPKRHLRSVAQVTAIVSRRPGDTVVKEGGHGSELFILLEGTARVTRRGRTVGRLAQGDYFGEVSLLDEGPRTATVVAETPLVCLTLAGKDFRSIMTKEPLLGLRVAQVLARRTRETERARIQ